MSDLIKFRRSTTSEWLEADPILENGEPSYDISTKSLRIGKGVKWSETRGFRTTTSAHFLDIIPTNDNMPLHVSTILTIRPTLIDSIGIIARNSANIIKNINSFLSYHPMV